MNDAPAAPILIVHRSGGFATLTLNRPAQSNALSEALLGDLQIELDRLAQDDSLRCLIIAAEGKAFCAGHDLREMRRHDDEAYFRTLFGRCGRLMQSLRALPVPVIAQVQGVATAAGCQLVAACDLAVAAEGARFAVSGIDVGLFCSTPAVALSRNVPLKAAFDMLVTGRFVDAATALRHGLVNAVVPHAALADAVEDLAGEICAKAPEAIRLGKQMFYRQLGLPLDEAYAYAAEVMACDIMGRHAQDGIDAFLNKAKLPQR